jgi:hypothetical protein
MRPTNKSDPTKKSRRKAKAVPAGKYTRGKYTFVKSESLFIRLLLAMPNTPAK